MLTSKKKSTPPKMVWMKCPEGVLVPRPPGPPGPRIPKERKFYNWPKDENGQLIEDREGFPTPKDIPEVVVEVVADHHHLVTCIHKGPCSLTKAPKADKKGGK
jgi:hypothetical protein